MADVAAVQPEPDLVQLLTPEGQRVEHPDYPLEIDDDEIGRLYRDLVLVRRIDSEAIALQRQGELGLWASLLGQEAAQIGAGRALRPQDMAFPTYREHGVAWCKDVDPLTLLGLFRGTNLGGWNPSDNNFNLYTIVIGAQTLHATGYAMGVARDGAVGTGDPDRDTAVIAFFGDGASSQGDVNEAFVWAGAGNLPVVFFCQNNQWAISEPVTTQSRVPLYHRATGFGFPGVRVDGNDVLACLAVTRKAMDDARSAQGPTLIEAFTYRMNPHTTNDDPRRYRPGSEADTWKLKDPLERVRAYLTREAGFGADFFSAIEDEGKALAEHIRTGCRALPDPSPSSLFDHVNVTLDPDVVAQRAGFVDFVSEVAK
ncbi:thiamine pyrophosphate-dependent dehydrogenase E1 component subunit alpha [Jatrophihabitans endophyticus]|uniref:thiamine pyrophosphate-dependent dehydrogenase E1 component subunit alpha n=1 Tax=Jatrophihabitans endophyticus TaxID=1206085 RepID=UPI0019E21868|nr:thiamine pyrophosphate-dependent dehydrogenase E1 component subunit alpha [Jatrophihabitans endophyticus]